jgi:RNA polymerase sigma-70 factor (ECF subfamily)
MSDPMVILCQSAIESLCYVLYRAAQSLQLLWACRVMALNEPTPVQTPTPEPSRSTEFTMFMRAYQDMVFSTAARLAGNDPQAEDIAQEVFIKAYENFDHLRLSATAGGWLKTVATNLSLNYLTRYRKRWRLFSESDSIPDVPQPDTALESLSEEEQRFALEEALRRLPAHQRVPLVLFHFDDLSYEDIAAKLDISLAKVKTDIRRGRAALAPLLQLRGIGGGS